MIHTQSRRRYFFICGVFSILFETDFIFQLFFSDSDAEDIVIMLPT